MTSIRCPICRTDVSGDNELSLTHSLRAHMSEVHEIKDLCAIPPGTLPQENVSSTKAEGRGPEDWEAIKREERPTDREVGEDVEESILCPLCGSRVFGHDGDDLSNNLHDHIEDVHDLRPVRVLPRVKR